MERMGQSGAEDGSVSARSTSLRRHRAESAVLRRLAVAAAAEWSARQDVADADNRRDLRTPKVEELRSAQLAATARWVALIRLAAADGHSIAGIAEAAGITPTGVHRWLR